MSEQEYRNGLKEIEEEAEKKRRSLIVRWLHENRKYKDGEIIKDHVHTGHIVKAKVSKGYFPEDLPSIIYYCIRLKKDGTPKTSKKTGKPEEIVIYENTIK